MLFVENWRGDDGRASVEHDESWRQRTCWWTNE